MNKELESLERLAMPDELHKQECERLGISLTQDYKVVKQAITELNQIKEANPSEAMKCWKNMQDRIAGNISTIEYTTIEQALTERQTDKQKAECWELFIKKPNEVSFALVYLRATTPFSDYEDYCLAVSNKDYKLSKKEFEKIMRGFSE